MIPLDIISDPICPWCYIGKARLDAAIAELGHDPFIRRWRIFRLNPDMPREGMERQAYLDAKFGGREGADRIYGRIEAVARESGLETRFDLIRRTPDTLDAHRLLRWAEAEGVQNAVADGLFRSYFVEGADISAPEVLTAIAGEAGMDGAVVARLLEGEADRAELAAEDDEARRMGVSGVPCFVINGRYVIQGAQETETWVRVIRELSAAIAEAEAGNGDGAAPGGATP
ncbi:DsbA family oxidoreductase [Paralimibaculum aggregatum]|uniref:DsbA family oxidoreductase n=1 Tax=Paralimibaculum aggregatum TaxID=3036245 RepID=A0ABQ6LP44_9RHOB|nr:DsbA family oxidoreductase [Limibaculum sp. NKW23]GMG83482.1 DsbA family oxidoreductase [Limibaculum sp. NKW23]